MSRGLERMLYVLMSVAAVIYGVFQMVLSAIDLGYVERQSQEGLLMLLAMTLGLPGLGVWTATGALSLNGLFRGPDTLRLRLVLWYGFLIIVPLAIAFVHERAGLLLGTLASSVAAVVAGRWWWMESGDSLPRIIRIIDDRASSQTVTYLTYCFLGIGSLYLVLGPALIPLTLLRTATVAAIVVAIIFTVRTWRDRLLFFLLAVSVVFFLWIVSAGLGSVSPLAFFTYGIVMLACCIFYFNRLWKGRSSSA